MSDLVVTVPKNLWRMWLDEGDLPGQPWSGMESTFYLGGGRPPITVGERLYIVAHDRVRGYAPVTQVVRTAQGWGICRHDGAVAITIPQKVTGFRGWRIRWWDRTREQPFPDWKTAHVPQRQGPPVQDAAGQGRLV